MLSAQNFDKIVPPVIDKLRGVGLSSSDYLCFEALTKHVCVIICTLKLNVNTIFAMKIFIYINKLGKSINFVINCNITQKSLKKFQVSQIKKDIEF